MASDQDKVRQHYDNHAGHLSTAKTRAAREAGDAAPLKKLHNDIKRLLLQRFATKAQRLLDLACGRGGDLNKWISCQVGYVKGVDLSENEILEAQKRFNDAKLERTDFGNFTAKFVCHDKLGQADFPPSTGQYDVVTCMFAIHYFFHTEATAHQFLRNVAHNLQPGGHFLGTVPGGRRVMETINKGQSWPLYEQPMLTLKAMWTGEVAPFGCGYTCAIGDTVTAGMEGSAGSYEYLVFFSTFVALAKHYGLEAVADYQMPRLEALLDPADKKNPVKHFMPRFGGSDPSLEQASRLFAAFVFRRNSQPLPPRFTPSSRKRPREEVVAPARPGTNGSVPHQAAPTPALESAVELDNESAKLGYVPYSPTRPIAGIEPNC